MASMQPATVGRYVVNSDAVVLGQALGTWRLLWLRDQIISASLHEDLASIHRLIRHHRPDLLTLRRLAEVVVPGTDHPP